MRAVKVNEGNSEQWVTPDSDSSHAASLTGGSVSGGRFAARTVAVRSYPLVRSSPHLPYLLSVMLGAIVRLTGSKHSPATADVSTQCCLCL